MKRTFVLLCILFGAHAMYGACVAVSSGGWVNGSNWSGCAGTGGVPASTDAVTVGTGFAMTCNGTCDFLTLTQNGTSTVTVQNNGAMTNHCTVAPCLTLNGTSVFETQSGGTSTLGANTTTANSKDVVINSGTAFILDNGGTLLLSGSISWVTTTNSVTKLFLNGHTLVSPNGNTNQRIQHTISGIAYNSPQFQCVGPSWSSPAVIETRAGQAAGGNFWLQQNGGAEPEMTFNFCILNNIGDTGAGSNPLMSETTPSTTFPCDFSMTNTLIMGDSGQMTYTTNSGVLNTSIFVMNAVDFRDPGTGQVALIGSTNNTVPSPARTITNITMDVEGTAGTLSTFDITGSNFNFGSSTLFPSNGSSDTAGLVCLNCSYTTGSTAINNIEENFLIGYDATVSNTLIAIPQLTNNIYQNSMAYEHALNPHFYNSTVVGSSTQDFYKYNLMDGDFWEPGDSGEICHSGGTWTCIHNINMNGNGNLENSQSPQSLTLDNNLQWNQSSISPGETVANALELTEVYDNLFECPLCLNDAGTFPAGNPGQCLGYESGISPQAAYATQTNLNEDFNWKWNFPGESDPRSFTCTRTIAGGVFPFMGIYAIGNGDYRGATALNNKTSTTGTGTNCPSTCELDYATGGFNSGTGDQIVQVNDVIYNNTNNQWTTVSAVNSNTQLILNAGPISSFTIASGNNFSVLKGQWADHSAIGGATNRGSHDVHADAYFYQPLVSMCTWYNSIGGALTCPTKIEGSGSTDANILTIMHAAVTINGWDFGSATSLTGTNCTNTCPVRVTPWGHTASEILRYAGQNFRVYNGRADNAGHTGLDVGPAWLQNYPAALLASQ